MEIQPSSWEKYVSPDAVEATDLNYQFLKLETHCKWLLRTQTDQGVGISVWRVEGLRPQRKVLYSDKHAVALTAYLYNDPIDGWTVKHIELGWPA